MTTPTSEDRFYFFSFIGMAMLCLGGFVPSFFLRPQFFDDPLPVWMNIHGVLFTLWYPLAILQSWLILKNKRVLPRIPGVRAPARARLGLCVDQAPAIYRRQTRTKRALVESHWSQDASGRGGRA